MASPVPVIVLDGRIKIDKLVAEQRDNLVFGGVDLTTGEEVAVKAESKQFLKRSGYDKTSPLQHEVLIMKDLETKYETPFFPRVVWEQENRHYNVVALEMFGENLFSLRKSYEFSNYTVLSVAIDMLKALEKLHNAGYIHLDVKPDNFVVGKGNNKKNVYIIDFGQTDKFPVTPQHWGTVTNDRCGNVYFASVLWHNSRTMCVWDDLESLAYTLAYLKIGHLPWLQRTYSSVNDDIDMMRSKVEATNRFLLPQLKEDSYVIIELLMAARRRETNKPDYKYFCGRFEEALKKLKPKTKLEWC